MRIFRFLPFLPAFCACVGDDNNVTHDSGTDAIAATDSSSDTSTPQDAASDADAGPFTPASLDATGSLALWLEASSANLTISNGLVEKWSDRSKNHNDATNPSTGPTIDTGAVNGHDALAFTSGVVLTIADAATLRFGTDQVFIAAVGKDTASGQLGFFSKAQSKTGISGTIFYQGFELIGTAGAVDGGSATIPLVRYAQDFNDGGTSSVQTEAYDLGPLFDDSHFHIVGARRPNGGTLTVYADDKTETNSNTSDDDVSVPGIAVNIGALHYGKIVAAVNGEIAEVIVVHASIISDATVANVLAYLKTKYAL